MKESIFSMRLVSDRFMQLVHNIFVAPASISEKVQVTISKDVILRLMPT